VTDLGVARALEQRPTPELLFSRSGLLGGTLAYVSPEQLSPASPALGPRTDVYALGAVLYELLAGVPPFEVRRLRRAGWVEMCRIIQRENPERPSRRVAALDHIRSSEVARQRGTERRRLRRALEGDLDWITLKALEKDPKGRYPSARELGLDVRRARDGEPVAPGWGSAARRLLRLLRPS
jgi:serine/threonine protein kinase